MQVQWPKAYCPCGCKNADPELGTESDFDPNGLCKHLVGTLNLAPGQKPMGKFFEPLEPIAIPVYDENDKPIIDVVEDPKTGKITRTPRMQHSGNMRSNGRARQKILDTDIVVTAEQYQRETTIVEYRTDDSGASQEIKRIPRLGIAARVYRKDANVAVITKTQDDDPAQERRNRADELFARAEEELAKAAEIDKARRPSDVDEVAQADAAGKAERKRMKEGEFVAQS